MSDELEERIAMLEAARAEFSEARTDAIRVAAQRMAELEPHTTAVQSAEMFDRLVAITERAIKAESALREPTFGLV